MYKIDLEKEEHEITRQYRDLLQDTYQYLSDDDKKIIRKAFDVAKDAHKNQRRKSGEPYLYHPIAVAKIVAYDIGLGVTGIAAGLMHDVVEDSEDYTVESVRTIFGDKIATIIDGLTKIEFIKHQDVSVQTENYRKLLLTLSEDVRVILVKLADRLHNMRTMKFMPPRKQIKIASETLFIYAPLAHRLGLYSIKTELENLSLKYTEPNLYLEIKRKLRETKEEREDYIHDFSQKVKERLDNEGFEYTIKGRPKSIYSIYKKMTSKNVTFEEVYDKFAIRIIFKSTSKNEKFNAWKIYSIVTDNFKPNPSRLRDWISQPKSTGYEALHTTVMGLNNRWVEVQIRSYRMDEIAEKGIATHYKYKHNSKETESNLEVWINKIKDVIENENLESNEFIDNVKLNLYAKEIFVFTPNGDLKSLPKGSTALDFAYDIHSKIGDTCSGAKINGVLRPLSHILKSGNNVEIITSSTQKPNPNWLDIVHTSKARSKIKTALKEERKKVAKEGKEILSRKLRHLKINMNETTINSLVNYFKASTSQDVFFKVGIGQINSKDLRSFSEDSQGGIYNIFKRFRRKSNTTSVQKEPSKSNLDLLVFGNNEDKLDYTLANCCNPIAGDFVFGFISVNQGIKVHKQNCPNAISLRANYNYRILPAKWVDSSDRPFITKVQLKGLDRVGIVTDITNLITKKLHVKMHGVNLNSNDGIFDGKLKLHVKNKTELEKILRELKNIKGIKSVERSNK
ncbi:MAG: RelA/SpoT family protein [Flavobacteriales bacterium]